uniref:Uncharacterized protein n=1 Tax=candidate division WOR-3 bacterium TaxID=2052148 RepID=A0A7C6EDW1_UNCW3
MITPIIRKVALRRQSIENIFFKTGSVCPTLQRGFAPLNPRKDFFLKPGEMRGCPSTQRGFAPLNPRKSASGGLKPGEMRGNPPLASPLRGCPSSLLRSILPNEV